MSLDYGKILKKAFHIAKNNRSLWVFGFLLTLLSSSSFPTNFNFPSNFSGGGGKGGIGRIPRLSDLGIDPQTLITIIVVILLGLVVLWLISIFVQSLSRGALIDMVNEIDKKSDIYIKGGFKIANLADDNSKVTVRGGFKVGFGYALPLIGISLIIGLAIMLVLLVLGGITLVPGIWLLVSKNTVPGGIMIALGGLVFLLVAVPAAIVLGIVSLYANRYFVLKESGIIESIRNGYSLFRQNIGASVLLWIINVGVGIGQGIIVLLIALILFLVLGLILGLPIVLLAISINKLIYGFLVIPIALFFVAIIFIGGLFQSFFSAYWTLAFKDLTLLTSN